jgi:hypothetical protein
MDIKYNHNLLLPDFPILEGGFDHFLAGLQQPSLAFYQIKLKLIIFMVSVDVSQIRLLSIFAQHLDNKANLHESWQVAGRDGAWVTKGKIDVQM